MIMKLVLKFLHMYYNYSRSSNIYVYRNVLVHRDRRKKTIATSANCVYIIFKKMANAKSLI